MGTKSGETAEDFAVFLLSSLLLNSTKTHLPIENGTTSTMMQPENVAFAAANDKVQMINGTLVAQQQHHQEPSSAAFQALPLFSEGATMPTSDSSFFGVPDDCVFHPTVNNYIMIVSFCIIFCLSVIGNSIVVVVILQNRSMRSVTNLYLLNLALSDLLLSVVCMPPTLVNALVYCWVFGDLLCRLLAYLQPMVVTASAYTLAAIALERYFAICRPLHSRVWHTKRHAMLVIGLVWLLSLVVNVMMLFMYEEKRYSNGINCAFRHRPIWHFAYQIYMTILLLIIPLITMICLYGSVIRSLTTGIRVDIASIEVQDPPKSSKSSKHCSVMPSPIPSVRNGRSHPQVTVIHEDDRKPSRVSLGPIIDRTREMAPWMSFKRRNSPRLLHQHKASFSLHEQHHKKPLSEQLSIEQQLRSTHSGRSILAKQRLIRMLIVIVIIFFCCWTPSYIWWILVGVQDSFGIINIWNSEWNTFITVLTYFSSCTNPITYCFLNSKFRDALSVTFGCRRGPSKGAHFQRNLSNEGATTLKQMNGKPNSGRSTHSLGTTGSGEGSQRQTKSPDLRACFCCLDVVLRMKNAFLSRNNGVNRRRTDKEGCGKSSSDEETATYKSVPEPLEDGFITPPESLNSNPIYMSPAISFNLC